MDLVTVYPLASGSSGNAFYISRGSPYGGILIDAGISCRKIIRSLEEAGIEKEGIRGIVVTHAHSDHINGLCILCKRCHVPIYGTEDTIQGLRGLLPEDTCYVPLKASQEIGGMMIHPFKTSHDCEGSCGFRIQAGDREIGFATDLGIVTPNVWEGMNGVHLAIVESNYDPMKLRFGPYPPYLQERIASDCGHLSNEDAAQLVLRLVKTGTTHIVLAHLSHQNNEPALARKAVETLLQQHDYKVNRDYKLWVAPRDNPGEIINF